MKGHDVQIFLLSSKQEDLNITAYLLCLRPARLVKGPPEVTLGIDITHKIGVGDEEFRHACRIGGNFVLSKI